MKCYLKQDAVAEYKWYLIVPRNANVGFLHIANGLPSSSFNHPYFNVYEGTKLRKLTDLAVQFIEDVELELLQRKPYTHIQLDRLPPPITITAVRKYKRSP
jgi:hypothetical protein